MPPVQSTTIEGYSVVLYPGICHVSKGYEFATLEEVLDLGRLHVTNGEPGIAVTDHQILLINQWATAHGYIKERRCAGTQTSKATNATIRWFDAFPDAERQRALPLEVPANIARRCARPA